MLPLGCLDLAAFYSKDLRITYSDLQVNVAGLKEVETEAGADNC